MISLFEKIKIRFRFIEKKREKIEETDAYISEFYSGKKRTFLQVILLYALSMIFWSIEIHFTLLFVGIKTVTLLESFLVVTLGTVAFIIPTIPGALGTYELTFVAILALFGISASVSMTVTLVRRILALFWAGIGLLAMGMMAKRRFKRT